MIPVHVVGLGMSPEDLTPRAWEILRRAEVLAGGRRLLDYFAALPAETVVLGKDPEKTLKELARLAEHRQVVILASGDPNFFGIGPLAVRVFGAENVVIHPNLTAVQAAAGRLKIPWEEVRVVSLHGRGWEPLEKALREGNSLFLYTDPRHSPAAVARKLLEWGFQDCRLCILEDLGQPRERITWLSPAEAARRVFSPLNMVYLELPANSGILPGEADFHLGMPEAAFAHEAGLITKTEVRAVVLAKLGLRPGLVLWDIGAGSGSVGLEASLLLGEGRIFAVEKDPRRAAQLAANRKKFRVWNLEVVLGEAPHCLEPLPDPDRVFIGGGGPNLGAILDTATSRLKPGGKLVIAASRLESLETARRHFASQDLVPEIIQIQISRGRPLAGGIYLQALNPVWLICAAQGG